MKLPDAIHLKDECVSRKNLVLRWKETKRNRAILKEGHDMAGDTDFVHDNIITSAKRGIYNYVGVSYTQSSHVKDEA